MDDAAISQAQIIFLSAKRFKAEGFIGAARGHVMVTDLKLQPGKAERSGQCNDMFKHAPGNVPAPRFGNDIDRPTSHLWRVFAPVARWVGRNTWPSRVRDVASNAPITWPDLILSI